MGLVAGIEETLARVILALLDEKGQRDGSLLWARRLDAVVARLAQNKLSRPGWWFGDGSCISPVVYR